MTNAEARFNNSLRPRKPEGSLGRTAQDVHLDSHTAPELCPARLTSGVSFITAIIASVRHCEPVWPSGKALSPFVREPIWKYSAKLVGS